MITRSKSKKYSSKYSRSSKKRRINSNSTTLVEVPTTSSYPYQRIRYTNNPFTDKEAQERKRNNFKYIYYIPSYTTMNDNFNIDNITITLTENESKLFALVSHKGRSADSGHYIGWVRQEGDNWICFDDDQVDECKTSDVLLLKGGGDRDMGYLLFYRAKK